VNYPIFSMRNINKVYPGSRPHPFARRLPGHHALRDLSLQVLPGDRIAIVGESGSGKTTLARQILALDTPTSGERLFRDSLFEQLTRSEQRRFRAECRMIFQNVNAMLNPLLKVREIIEEPMLTHTSWSASRRENRLQEVLTEVNAKPQWLDQYPHRLSGGERRRVSLARAFVVPPKLLVADEPVAGLDVVMQAEILDLIDQAVLATGGSLVVISHDIHVVQRLCTKFYVLYAGNLVEVLPNRAGAPRPSHPYSRALFRAADYLGNPEEAGETGPGDRGPLMMMPAGIGAPPETGCPFRPRCRVYEAHADKASCEREFPEMRATPDQGMVACHHADLIGEERA